MQRHKHGVVASIHSFTRSIIQSAGTKYWYQVHSMSHHVRQSPSHASPSIFTECDLKLQLQLSHSLHHHHRQMSAAASIPRFLLPRGGPSLRRQHDFLRRLHLSATSSLPVRRHASTQPNKPLVLEKPERFNPPSHGSRPRARPRSYPGPALSEAEKQEQKTKRYPNMMPAEGTFTYWFLTNKMLHTFITLVGLPRR